VYRRIPKWLAVREIFPNSYKTFSNWRSNYWYYNVKLVHYTHIGYWIYYSCMMTVIWGIERKTNSQIAEIERITHLIIYISIMTQPCVGFTKIIKYMQPIMWLRCQNNWRSRISLCCCPHTMNLQRNIWINLKKLSLRQMIMNLTI